MAKLNPMHATTTGLDRLAWMVEARRAARGAVLAGNVLLLICALLLFFAGGAYGMEHESRDSLEWLAALLNFAMVITFFASLVCTVVFVFGRPRRLARYRARLGVAATLIGWPAACILVVVVVVVIAYVP